MFFKDMEDHLEGFAGFRVDGHEWDADKRFIVKTVLAYPGGEEALELRESRMLLREPIRVCQDVGRGIFVLAFFEQFGWIQTSFELDHVRRDYVYKMAKKYADLWLEVSFVCDHF
jgi:hypothetical protein